MHKFLLCIPLKLFRIIIIFWHNLILIWFHFLSFDSLGELYVGLNGLKMPNELVNKARISYTLPD